MQWSHLTGGTAMDDPAIGRALDYHMGEIRSDADAEAILDGTGATEPSLEQVREILFGAQSRRSEAARRALESKMAERLGRLEADYERRFEKLLQDMQQRFDRLCELLELESRARQNALQTQHDELVDEVAARLRAAAGA
jgi:hypothetical protein